MEKQLMPKLRFPKFEDEWEKRKLGEIGKVSMCKRIMKDQTKTFGDIPFYKIGTFGKEADAFIDKNIYEEFKAKYSFPQVGEILISASGTIGRTVIYDGKPAYFQDSNIVWVANNENIILNSLLVYSYENVRWTTENTTIARLYNDNLRNISISIPSLPEQQKIASFLSDVDDKITKLSKKKDLLEQYKKGIMQKIFSQGLRFKDDAGNEFPDWEEKHLGDITKYYDGTHQTPKYVSEGVPFYSVEHVTANQFEKTKFISEEVFEKENKRVRLAKGDILMTRIGNIGKAKYIDWDVRASFYVSLALIKQHSSFSSKYLSQFINSTFFQRELWKRTIHVAFPQKINLGEIGNCVVRLPSLKEQTKIANFLLDIDLKIETLNTKIKNSKAFKKGLLQQMFV